MAGTMESSSAVLTEKYIQSAMNCALGQILQNFGFTGNTTDQVLQTMTDTFERYVHELCRTTQKYKELAGRTDTNLADVEMTFEDMGIKTNELEDFCRQLEPVKFAHEVVAFPVPRESSLNFPDPNSQEIIERPEHIFDYLPSMIPRVEVPDSPVKAAPSSSQGSQPAVSNGTIETSPVATSDKRPAGEPSTPGLKRPRISELPEEAGHSQYQMTCVTQTNSGILRLRQGRKPDGRMPPPPVRYSQPAFVDTMANTIHDRPRSPEGTNKENADEPPEQTPPVRISVSGKSGAVIISPAPPAAAGTAPKADGKKKLKKKEKLAAGGKKKKPKAPKVDLQEPLFGGELLNLTRAPPPAVPPVKDAARGAPADQKEKKKVQKEKKEKKPKEKKVKKLKISTGLGKKTPSAAGASTAEVGKVETVVVYPPRSFTGPHSLEPESGLRQAFCKTDIFEPAQPSSTQHLMNIDDSINTVVRDSAADADRKDIKPVLLPPATVTLPAISPKKRGRPKKVKPTKSSEFVAEDVLKREQEDDTLSPRITSVPPFSQPPPPPAVVAASGDGLKRPAEVPAAGDMASPPTKKTKKDKEGKRKKKEKDGVVKEKKKRKVPKKVVPATIGEEDVKPEPDKFSQQQPEMKVFDFGQADSPPSLPVRRPSQAEEGILSPPPPPPPLTPSLTSSTPTRIISTPTSARGSMSPLELKPFIIKSPTPEAVVAASSASTSSATSADQPPILPLKIGIPREGSKEREKSKDRERRKEKKEKKKKKDKDRDREHRKDKHKHKKDRKIKEEKMEETTAEGSGFKIRIKLGSKDGGGASVTAGESRPPPPPPPEPVSMVVKREIEEAASISTSSPSQGGGLKLVIRRPGGHAESSSTTSQKKADDSSASDKKHSEPELGTSHKKHSEKKRERSEGERKKRSDKDLPHKKRKGLKHKEPRNTPPTLHPASPLPGTPPPPVLSRNNSPAVKERSLSPAPPQRSAAEPTRGRSPARRASPSSDAFHFVSPITSPRRGSRPSATPPPRTPSPSHMPKTPSPGRHRSTSPLNISFPSSPPPHSSWRKSPTPTPKTPTLSPCRPSSPILHSPPRGEGEESTRPSEPEGSPPPPSPTIPETSDKLPEKKETSSPAPSTSKPKGKVGRPKSKSPKGKSPKGPKSPKGIGRPPKPPPIPGKSPGRGRPPKAVTLAKRAAAAAAAKAAADEAAKGKPPALSPVHGEEEEDEDNRMPPPLPLASLEVGRGAESSSGSESPNQLSINIEEEEEEEESGNAYSGGVETETVGSYVDSSGQRIWICPSCKMVDDGVSNMIGCDKCDDWYHWVCVNITKEPPDDQSWFCPRCRTKDRKNRSHFGLQPPKPKGKRGRKKKVP